MKTGKFTRQAVVVLLTGTLASLTALSEDPPAQPPGPEATAELTVTVGDSSGSAKNNAALGLGYLGEEAIDLKVTFTTGDPDRTIRRSRVFETSGEIIWGVLPREDETIRPIDPAHLPPKENNEPDYEHRYMAVGIKPNTQHAARFEGWLERAGSGSGGAGGNPAGGGGRRPDFEAFLSDMDLDADTDNYYTGQGLRAPANPQTDPGLSDSEDYLEQIGVDASPESLPNMRMAMEERAQLVARINCKKAGVYVIESSDGATVRIYTDAECEQEAAWPVSIQPSPTQQQCIYYMKGLAFGKATLTATFIPEGSLAVRPASQGGTLGTTQPEGDDVQVGNVIHVGPDGVCDTHAVGEDVQVMPVGAESGNVGTNRATSQPDDSAVAVDKVCVLVTTEDPDTNRDDLVEIGNDIGSFGPDTGTIAWQPDPQRSRPQTYIPLAASIWNQLTVHAYLVEGAFTTARATYQKLQTAGAAPSGLWVAYSLHTRVADMDTTGGHKQVTIVRPRGNVVVFEFKPKDDGFEAYGVPLGINARRTYVLRDDTPGTLNDRDFSLHFDSGVIHEFNVDTGELEAVSHVDGRRVKILSGDSQDPETMAGVELDETTLMATQSPRYGVSVHWSVAGKLDWVCYVDRTPDSGHVILAEAKDTDDDDWIDKFTKKEGTSSPVPATQPDDVTGEFIGDFQVALSGQEITYGSGAETVKVKRVASREGTLVSTITPNGTIDKRLKFNTDDLVVERKVTVDGETAKTTYTYLPQADATTTDARYEANGAPKWAKVVQVVHPIGVWEKFEYYDDGTYKTGWLKKKFSPFKGSLPTTQPGEAEDESKHEVTDYVYDRSGAPQPGQGETNDPLRTEYLVEQPSKIETKIIGVTTAQTEYRYWEKEGKKKTTTTRKNSVDTEHSPSQLSTTVTRNTYGPSDVTSPTGGVAYTLTGSDPDISLALTVVRSGPNQATIDTTKSVTNAFGVVEALRTVDSGVTLAAMNCSSQPDGDVGCSATDRHTFGRLKKVTDSLTTLAAIYTYPADPSQFRGPSQVENPDGSKTSYQTGQTTTYNILGQPSSSTHFPNGSPASDTKTVVDYTYDAMGNVIGTKTTGYKGGEHKEVETMAAYDVLGRLRKDKVLTCSTQPDNPEQDPPKWVGMDYAYVTSTKDGAGTLEVTATDGDTKQTKTVYYIEGRPCNVSGSGTYPVSFDYGVDAAKGFWSKRSQNEGEDTLTSYSNMYGQAYKAVHSAATDQPAEVTFDEKGRPETIKGIDQVTATLDYDEHRNILSSRSVGSGDSLRTVTYALTVGQAGQTFTTTVVANNAPAYPGGPSVPQSTVLEEFVSLDGFTRSTTVNGKTVKTRIAHTGPGGWTKTTMKVTTQPDGLDVPEFVETLTDGELASLLDLRMKGPGGGAPNPARVTTDPLHNLVKFTSPRGLETGWSNHNQAGLPNTGELPGQNPGDRVWTATARNGNLVMTGRGRPGGSSQQFAITGQGQFGGAEGGGIHDFSLGFEAARGILDKVITPGNVESQLTLDPKSGLRTQKTLAANTDDALIAAHYTWNDKFQLTRVIRPATTQPGESEDDSVTIYEYDQSNGEVVTIQRGRRGAGENPVIEETEVLERDSKGRITVRVVTTQPEGPEVRQEFYYNADDQLTAKVQPGMGDHYVRYIYDGVTGKLLETRLMNGQTAELTQTIQYGDDGRPERIIAGGVNQDIGYFPNSHMLNMFRCSTDEDGETPVITTTLTPEQATERLGSVFTTTQPDGPPISSTSLIYDNLDHVCQEIVQGPNPITGHSESYDFHYRYDDKDQLVFAWMTQQGSPVPGESYQYVYDSAGNRTGWGRGTIVLDLSGVPLGLQAGAEWKEITYNLRNEMDGISVNGTVGLTLTADLPRGYTVELNGRRMKSVGRIYYGTVKCDSSKAATVARVSVVIKDAGGTVVGGMTFEQQIATSPVKCTFDGSGNLLQDDYFKYTWDPKEVGRLMEVEPLPDAALPDEPAKLVCGYAPDGTRTDKKIYHRDESGHWKATWDEWLRYEYAGNVIREYSASLNAEGGTVLTLRREYYILPAIMVWWERWPRLTAGLLPPKGRQRQQKVALATIIRDFGGHEVKTYISLARRSGRVRVVVDVDSGKTIASYLLSPYGMVRAKWPIGDPVLDPFLCGAMYYDQEVFLYHTGRGYYSPRFGRFIQRMYNPPRNPYVAAGNDPVSKWEVPDCVADFVSVGGLSLSLDVFNRRTGGTEFTRDLARSRVPAMKERLNTYMNLGRTYLADTRKFCETGMPLPYAAGMASGKFIHQQLEAAEFQLAVGAYRGYYEYGWGGIPFGVWREGQKLAPVTGQLYAMADEYQLTGKLNTEHVWHATFDAAEIATTWAIGELFTLRKVPGPRGGRPGGGSLRCEAEFAGKRIGNSSIAEGVGEGAGGLRADQLAFLEKHGFTYAEMGQLNPAQLRQLTASTGIEFGVGANGAGDIIIVRGTPPSRLPPGLAGRVSLPEGFEWVAHTHPEAVPTMSSMAHDLFVAKPGVPELVIGGEQNFIYYYDPASGVTIRVLSP